MTPLVIGTALAIAALCFVLWPLIAAPSVRAAALAYHAPENTAVEALKELEFDRATGKISDTDYESLKDSYTRKALTVMRAGDRPVCDRCGPRPEADAVFCSSCGGALST